MDVACRKEGTGHRGRIVVSVYYALRIMIGHVGFFRVMRLMCGHRVGVKLDYYLRLRDDWRYLGGTLKGMREWQLHEGNVST